MRQIRASLEEHYFSLLQHPVAYDSQQQWLAWLDRIAQGDQSALSSLYQDISSIVFGLILCIVADRLLAEEILLEVFKQVWKEAAAYDAKAIEPLAWILGLARLRALECLRAGKTQYHTTLAQNLLFSASQTEPERPSFIAQQQKRVRAALLSLSAIERQVIELAYFGGLSASAIATKLELPQNIVEKHLTFAMMQLRNFLNPSLQEQL